MTGAAFRRISPQNRPPREEGTIPTSPLFRDIAEEFLAYHRIYSNDVGSFPYKFRVLARAFGPLSLDQIELRTIESFVSERLAAGVSHATVNRNLAALSVMFSWAIRRGYHPGPNPVKGMRRFRESAGRTRYLTADEAARLVLAAATHLKPLIVAALHTGGRLGELLALCWVDVDFEAGTITFRNETTKSGRTRHLPMSSQLRACLLGLRRGRPDQRVFSWRGAPIHSVRTSFARACRKAGLRDVVFYSCRHSFSAWYIQNGGDLYRLQKYLGHSTINLTQRYAHLSPDMMADGARFFGPPGFRAKETEGET